jgi:hypothetical protein
VWISSGDETKLAILDASTRRVLRTIPAGPPPQHIAFARNAAWRSPARASRSRELVQRDRRRGLILTPPLERGTLAAIGEEGSRPRTVNVATAAHDACFVVGS